MIVNITQLIENIPDEISEISNLKQFSIQSNLIQIIPSSISELDSLSGLYINNNLIMW